MLRRLVLGLAAVAVWAACVGSDPVQDPRGALDQACTPAGTCLGALVCVNDVCVQPSAEGGVASSSSSGAGSSSSSGSTSSSSGDGGGCPALSNGDYGHCPNANGDSVACTADHHQCCPGSRLRPERRRLHRAAEFPVHERSGVRGEWSGPDVLLRRHAYARDPHRVWRDSPFSAWRELELSVELRRFARDALRRGRRDVVSVTSHLRKGGGELGKPRFHPFRMRRPVALTLI
jgi:hypothetical protein